MNKNAANPSPKLIWISLVCNLLLCTTALPLVLQNGSSFSALLLLETLFWQSLSLIGWPIVLVVGSLNFLLNGALPDLVSAISIGIYPFIWLVLLTLVLAEKRKWFSLIILHLLLVLSFINTWLPVFNGYNFMVG